MGMLESTIRDDLNQNAPRRMAVLDPLKVVITNYAEGESEQLTAPNHPQREEMGSRILPFGREIVIDRADFREERPNKHFKRLVSGQEVRLRNAYVIRCDEVVKDSSGGITQLNCSYDPETLGKNPADGRKVKGVIHWVSAEHGLPAEVRLYDRLFNTPSPEQVEEGGSFLDNINPDSLSVCSSAILEASLANAEAGDTFQFEREGYFCRDIEDAGEGVITWNRTVTLRDSWAKLEGK